MAPVTPQVFTAAEAARRESRALRRSAQMGRMELRRRSTETQRRHAECLTSYRWLYTSRDGRQWSPWSDLPWHYPDRDMDLTLVPVTDRSR